MAKFDGKSPFNGRNSSESKEHEIKNVAYWYVFLDNIAEGEVAALQRGLTNYFGRANQSSARIFHDTRYKAQHAAGLIVDPTMQREVLEGALAHFSKTHYKGMRHEVKEF